MNPTLLMVDDDVELGTLMQEFFASQGVGLDLSHDGESGLAKLAAGSYDLVLLDVMMPRLDGFAVLERLRKTSNVPVLMLTARLESASRIRGLESGADDYLPKPFEPMELMAREGAILRRSGGQVGVVEPYGVRVDPGARAANVDGKALELTSVEFDILEVMHRGAGRVVEGQAGEGERSVGLRQRGEAANSTAQAEHSPCTPSPSTVQHPKRCQQSKEGRGARRYGSCAARQRHSLP